MIIWIYFGYSFDFHESFENRDGSLKERHGSYVRGPVFSFGISCDLLINWKRLYR